MKLGRYSKAIVAAVTALSVAVSDSVLDLNDGVTIVLAVLGALGVYAKGNSVKG